MLLTEHLHRLTSLEPGPFPVISLYLDTRVNERGRREFGPLLDRDLEARVASYAAGTPERASLDRDVAQIREYIDRQLDPSAHGVAIFSCSGAGLFDAVQLAAPMEGHELYVSDRPHLYPLARVNDQYPRYAVLIADSNRAKLFVMANAGVERAEDLQNPKTRRPSGGALAQNRFQRHVENFHQHHAKEAAQMLDRAVRAEHIDHVVLGGDEAALTLIRAELPKHLADRVIGSEGLTIGSSMREVLDGSLQALRDEDARTDREKVDAALNAWRARGLGVAGAAATWTALQNGQVDELLIAAAPAALVDDRAVPSTGGGDGGAARASGDQKAQLAGELVALARQTAATVTMIEDPALLADVGGVAGLLRFRV